MATRGNRAIKATVRPSCVRVVLLTYKDSSIRPVVVPCGKWSCDECAERKLDDVMDQLKVASGGGDLFSIEVLRDRWDPVRKMAMRKGASYISFKRPNDAVLFVSDHEFRGRDWKLSPTTPPRLKSAALKRGIRRVDWCEAWRPEKPIARSTVGRVSLPAGWAGQVLERAGYDRVAGRIPGLDAFASAERISDAYTAIADERRITKSLVRGSDERGKSLVRGRSAKKRKRRPKSP